jgi:hypothetical protein
MGQHQPDDLNKGAAWKSKYDRIRHRFSPGSAQLGLASLIAAGRIWHIDTRVARYFFSDIAQMKDEGPALPRETRGTDGPKIEAVQKVERCPGLMDG